MSSSPSSPSPSPVTQIPAAPSAVAQTHFEALLALETDCWDVHESLKSPPPDFVLLQVTGGQDGFEAEHIAGANYLHHGDMTPETLADYPPDTTFVVYCAGPHCNGADRAAARLASLGRPVKKMIGGKTGWVDEGFTFVSS